MTVKLPLEGIRVVDMTAVWAGPFGTEILADLGAEVIRVEPIDRLQPLARGNFARPPKAMVERLTTYSSYVDKDPGPRPWNRWCFINANTHNKLSISLNIHRPQGMESFQRLVKVSDVVYENSLPETIERLGVTYEMLREVKEDIIYLRAPAMGTWGPYRGYRLHGASLESFVGLTALRGYRDVHYSTNTSTFVGDFAAGAQGAFAVLAALHHRRRTGEGQLIELSQGENALPVIGPAILDYTVNGRVQEPMGNRDPHAAPQGCYRCQGEDNWVNISVTGDGEWQALCRALGQPDLAADERFADALGRWRHHDELDRLIEAWTRPRDHYAVMYLLQREGVAAGPVLSSRQAFEDPHLRDRGFFKEVTQADCGTHLYPGPMFTMSRSPIDIYRAPPLLGEHNEYVYKELLGLTQEEYAALEQAGEIGMEFAPQVR